MSSIEGEFVRYKKLGEGVFDQLSNDQLSRALAEGGNSVASLVWHISGNLQSRFSDFLTTDGEKPSRNRESEFESRSVSLTEVEIKWAQGWSVLLATLSKLEDSHLSQNVMIRGVALSVCEALHRSLAHVSYHVGQMALLGRTVRGSEWRFLSIPPGGSAAYNSDPSLEKPPGR